MCVDVKDPEGRKIIYDVRYHLWKITLLKKILLISRKGEALRQGCEMNGKRYGTTLSEMILVEIYYTIFMNK